MLPWPSGTAPSDESFAGGILRVVSFFDDHPPPPEPLDPKPWWGPPVGWLGGSVPWRLVVLRSPGVYAVVTDVEAYQAGVSFLLRMRFLPRAADQRPPDRERREILQWRSPEGPLLGLRFSDGRKVMVSPPTPPPLEEPPGPTLRPVGGGGSARQWLADFWLWTLPPSGPMSFVTAWPARNIAERTTTMDASELTVAAAFSEELLDVV